MKKFKIKLNDMLDHIRYERNKWRVYGSGPMDYSKGRKVISFKCNFKEYKVEFIDNNKTKRVEYFTCSNEAVNYFNNECKE